MREKEKGGTEEREGGWEGERELIEEREVVVEPRQSLAGVHHDLKLEGRKR